MRAVKVVKQDIQPSEEFLDLLESFRWMVNEAIRIGLEKNITSRFRLCKEVYQHLHIGLHTWYILSAVEKACAILKNYRKALRRGKVKRPYVTKPFASIGNQGYTIRDGVLRIPVQPRRYVEIPLNRYVRAVLSDPSLKLGSITLTARTVVIAFSKEKAEAGPSGYIGLDMNLENVTLASSDGEVRHYDLSECVRIKSTYRLVKSRFRRNDVRKRREIFRKYGELEKNRITQRLHLISKDIVKLAKERGYAIVMEELKGIRGRYRRGNGQSRNFRAKMNSWEFSKLQKQIEYKAKWEGLKVIYVDARATSSLCAECGSRLNPNSTDRRLWCPKCKTYMDRDVNAARNILARGLRLGPDALPSEAMVEEPSQAVILKVDGKELTRRFLPVS